MEKLYNIPTAAVLDCFLVESSILHNFCLHPAVIFSFVVGPVSYVEHCILQLFVKLIVYP